MNVVIKFPLERVQRSTSSKFGAKKTGKIIMFSEFEQSSCLKAADEAALRTKAASKNKV